MRISDWSSDVCSSDLMGLGWFLDVDSRHPKMNHDGATMQQFASLHLLPKRKLAFALLFNIPSPLLPSEVREAIFTELAGVPSIPKQALPPTIAFDDKRSMVTYTRKNGRATRRARV